MDIEELGTTEQEQELSISSPSVPVSDPSVRIAFQYLLYILAHKSTTQDCEFLASSPSHFVAFLCPAQK